MINSFFTTRETGGQISDLKANETNLCQLSYVCVGKILKVQKFNIIFEAKLQYLKMKTVFKQLIKYEDIFFVINIKLGLKKLIV